MKVIDLLNKIYNDEIITPTHIFCADERYEISCLSDLVDFLGSEDFYLTDEVEVIEEKEMCHKCGKYPAEYNQTYCEFCLGISEEDKKIEKIKIKDDKTISIKGTSFYREKDIEIFQKLSMVINEIIDKINEGE